ncbi:hypothetical protein [Pseudonocardia alni]|uniref:hypothetical protein n=1 Tax=Pseudonocardia alni TaxID=33907 RepID=UPI001AD7779B|nr:hypothetical protein [Pseudonocardia alni]MBO4237988.1 hypothetical protein [Pseudonocardia alni]
MDDSIPLRRVLGAAAVAGTLPYLTLKTLWLTGHPVGVTVPGLLDGPAMTALNTATLLLDLCVVALAAALGARRRLPAVPLLLAGWAATGLLLPVALLSPAALLRAGTDGAGLAAWVRPLVYGGFGWQAVFLLAAFALLARDRWGARVTVPVPPPGAVEGLARTTAAGGVVVGLLAVVAGVAAAAARPSFPGVVGAAVDATAALTGALGVLALRRGRAGWSPVLMTFTGSAVLFTGGLWTLVSATAGPLATDRPLYVLAQLCGLLAGFAVAVAGMLVVSGRMCGPVTVSPRPAPVP